MMKLSWTFVQMVFGETDTSEHFQCLDIQPIHLCLPMKQIAATKNKHGEMTEI